jgi:hypothetical protein
LGAEGGVLHGEACLAVSPTHTNNHDVQQNEELGEQLSELLATASYLGFIIHVLHTKSKYKTTGHSIACKSKKLDITKVSNG